MLQAVHKKTGALQASSLYCQWISAEAGGHQRLVAVWIDCEMRAFVGGQPPEAAIELWSDAASDDVPDLGDGAAVFSPGKEGISDSCGSAE